jgi:hypothetical protein
MNTPVSPTHAAALKSRGHFIWVVGSRGGLLRGSARTEGAVNRDRPQWAEESRGNFILMPSGSVEGPPGAPFSLSGRPSRHPWRGGGGQGTPGQFRANTLGGDEGRLSFGWGFRGGRHWKVRRSTPPDAPRPGVQPTGRPPVGGPTHGRPLVAGRGVLRMGGDVMRIVCQKS